MRWWLVVLLMACEGADHDPGYAAWLRVEGAQYESDPLPSGGAGPELVALRVPHSSVLPGERSELISGALAASATSVLVALEGDRGHYIVTAGAATFEEPGLPSFRASLSFATTTPAGPLTLALSAVDAQGRVGPRKEVALTAQGRTRSPQLSIELRWDREADLDLHVITPDGTELYPRNINTYGMPAPAGAAPSPNAYLDGGILDLDSNANCVIDGRREERASWSVPPASGVYTVRVATASLCAESIAHWTLEVWRAGQLAQTVQGISQSYETRYGTGLGAGTLACEFTVP